MPDPRFAPLAERIIDDLLSSDPVLASRAGEHSGDDTLPDLSHDGVARQVAMFRDASAALTGVDIDGLDIGERVDHEQLLTLVERRLFDLTEIREHEWNPLAHNPGALIHSLVTRPYAPLTQRLEAIAGRLRRLPDALASARTTLRDCPSVHAQTAVGQFRGLASFVRDEVPPLLADAPALRSVVAPAAAVAVAELDSFADWLAAALGRRDRGLDLALDPAFDPALDAGGEDGREPRLGRRLWEAKLWHTLDTEVTADELLRRAKENLDRVTDEIRAAAAQFTGGPADDDTVRAALNRLADEHPDSDSIVDEARRALAETHAFVVEQDLVSTVGDRCEIMVMPQFARGVAVAYCDAPGPLEPARLPTFYCIAPAPAGWTAQQVESFYREYNNHLLRSLTVHEAMPGHFLQLAHARRYHGGTRVRAVARSGSFIEGWAVYAEQLMADHGFHGLPGRLQQLKMLLRTTINAILDQHIHCDAMTRGEAMALMTERGFQEEGEAAGKWRRALVTSTQLCTYFVGYTELSAVAAARPAGVAPRAWHDAMLSHGSPAPRHLPALLAAG